MGVVVFQLCPLLRTTRAFCFPDSSSYHGIALSRSMALFQVLTAVSHMPHRRYSFLFHELPNGHVIHAIMHFIPRIGIFLEILPLEVDQLRRVNPRDVVDVKMLYASSAHQVAEHAAVLPLAGTDAIPAWVKL